MYRAFVMFYTTFNQCRTFKKQTSGYELILPDDFFICFDFQTKALKVLKPENQIKMTLNTREIVVVHIGLRF